MLALQTNRSWPDDPNLSRRGSQTPSNSNKKCGGSRSPCIFDSRGFCWKDAASSPEVFGGCSCQSLAALSSSQDWIVQSCFWLLSTRTWHFEGFSLCQKALHSHVFCFRFCSINHSWSSGTAFVVLALFLWQRKGVALQYSRTLKEVAL